MTQGNKTCTPGGLFMQFIISRIMKHKLSLTRNEHWVHDLAPHIRKLRITVSQNVDCKLSLIAYRSALMISYLLDICLPLKFLRIISSLRQSVMLSWLILPWLNKASDRTNTVKTKHFIIFCAFSLCTDNHTEETHTHSPSLSTEKMCVCIMR